MRPLVILGIWLAACAGPTVTPTSTPARSGAPATPTQAQVPIQTSTPSQSARSTPAIEHPTGARDVVLRMWRSGGFLYPGTTIDEAPTFTLYGDGRVIYTIEQPRPDGSPERHLAQALLSEEQVGALLENALGPGGLALAREQYADVPMADGTTTNFEINAAGLDKTVSVYALGEWSEPLPDSDARDAFESLAAALREFGAEVADGNATDLGKFEPEAYRLSIFPDVASDFASTADWPWPDLQPSDFPRDNSGFGRLVGTPTQGELVAGLPVAEIGDPIVIGPDGVNYVVRARPLLPDEEP